MPPHKVYPAHCQVFDSFDRLLGRADGALYAAKANGRNRVEIAEQHD